MSQRTCDVLVVGAGVAGLAAAVAAARKGANTILVEQEAEIGGTATQGMLRQICGLYAAQRGSPVKPLNSGLSRELVTELTAAWPGSQPVLRGRVWVLPFRLEDLTALFKRWLDAAKVFCLLRARVLGVETYGRIIRKVAISCPEGVHAITPGAVVDCTGFARVALLCGAAASDAPQPSPQMAGYVLRLQGLEAVRDLTLQVPWALARGVAMKELPKAARWATFEPGDAPTEGYLKLSIPGDGSETAYQSMVHRTLEWLRLTLPSFQQVAVVASSGVLERQGTRLAGEYELSAEHVLEGRKVANGCARGAWPIEIWDSDQGFILRHLKAGDYYDIPASCLRSRRWKNLWGGGRCISATWQAMASVRVMGISVATGEAAGADAVAWVGSR